MPEALGVNDWELRREVREEGRSGVDGREGGLLRVAEVERFAVGRGPEAGVDMAATELVAISKVSELVSVASCKCRKHKTIGREVNAMPR